MLDVIFWCLVCVKGYLRVDMWGICLFFGEFCYLLNNDFLFVIICIILFLKCLCNLILVCWCVWFYLVLFWRVLCLIFVFFLFLLYEYVLEKIIFCLVFVFFYFVWLFFFFWIVLYVINCVKFKSFNVFESNLKKN